MTKDEIEVSCLRCGGYDRACERCHGTGVVQIDRLTMDERRRHFDGPTDAELGLGQEVCS